MRHWCDNRSGGVIDLEFEAFVVASSEPLLRVAYLLTGDRGHGEDLLQTALWRTARRWEVARNAPEAYARRTIVNLSHDRWRHLRRRPREHPLEGSPESAEGDGTREILDRQTLAGALQQLPVRQRQVVVLRFFVDLSVSETAAVIGCSEGAVKTHCSRALARLRELLAEPAGDMTQDAPDMADEEMLITLEQEVHDAD
jgi:RNA polymerase sigma-70 factor (sigma-E family)